MMQRIFLVVICAGLLFSTATVTMAAGAFGETDLMFTPTTDILHLNNLGIAADFEQGQISYFNCDYGLVKDLELGLALYNDPNTTQLSLRGKYRLLHENGNTPGLAIGIEDIGNGSDNISPFMVISKHFSELGIEGDLGLGGGSLNGIFAGINKRFYLDNSAKNNGPLKQVDLYLEADTKGLNIGTKLSLGSQLNLNFGLVNMNNWILGVSFLLK